MGMMEKPAEWRRMYGRTISINMDKCRKFQCGGFFVTVNHPIDIVQEGAQVDRILNGLRSGELIDITDTHSKGLVIGGIGHSATTSQHTGKKVFITVDRDGGIAIKSAETPEEIAECEAAIAKTGVIVPQDYKISESRGFEGRVQSGQSSLLLHNLSEKIEDINTKVFGSSPTTKTGPNKVT